MKVSKIGIWILIDSIIVAVAAIALYSYFNMPTSSQKRGAATFVTTKPEDPARSIASIEKVFDFSYLEQGALAAAAKKRVASSMSTDVSVHGDEALIFIGNYVLNNEKTGAKDFACGYYDQVELLFEAEGVAVNGEKPTLKINARCGVSGDVNQMLPIRIPLARIQAEKPGDVELQFHVGASPLKLLFSNAPKGQWPTQWHLKETVLKHSVEASRILRVDGKDVADWNEKPVVMNWQFQP